MRDFACQLVISPLLTVQNIILIIFFMLGFGSAGLRAPLWLLTAKKSAAINKVESTGLARETWLIPFKKMLKYKFQKVLAPPNIQGKISLPRQCLLQKSPCPAIISSGPTFDKYCSVPKVHIRLLWTRTIQF